jgi:two-component sensor histidine kinase
LLESSSVVIEIDGAPSILAVLRDVTEIERAELARVEAEVAVRAALTEKEILLQEIHHRVKNNLHVIASLINLQSVKLEDGTARAALEEIRARVSAIALLHEKLYQSKDLARIDMGEYVNRLLSDLVRMHGALAKGIRINTHVDDVRLDLETAMPCGLILNELLSNALRHAFRRPGEEPPRIEVALTSDAQGCELSVADRRRRSIYARGNTTVHRTPPLPSS